jgi:hypothetical protein
MTPLGIPMIVGLLGAVVTWVHLRVFDKLFLRYGKVKGEEQQRGASKH